MLQIVWKQKHQSGHGTCDKKILTPPSIRICPLFGELKKGIFLPPSLPYRPMSLSQQFFLDSIPNKFQLNEDTCSQQMLLIEKTSLLHQSLMMQTVHNKLFTLVEPPAYFMYPLEERTHWKWRKHWWSWRGRTLLLRWYGGKVVIR